MIRRFNDGIGFSFWHHFDPKHGTAIRYRFGRARLIGIRVTSFDRGEEDSVQIGLWWAVTFSLCAVHQKRFTEAAR